MRLTIGAGGTQTRSGVCRWSTAVAAVLFDWRPVGAHRKRRRRELCERFVGISYLPAHDRQDGFQTFDVILGNREVIGGEYTQVG